MNALCSAALASLAVLALAPGARAYCRTTTCEDVPVCESDAPGTSTGCVPVYWPTPCVGISLDISGLRLSEIAQKEDWIAQAAGAWTNDLPDGVCPAFERVPGEVVPAGRPGLRLTPIGKVRCGHVEYNPLQGNANVVIFRDTWPYGGVGNDELGRTTVTFNIETGEIYDSDIEINEPESRAIEGYEHTNGAGAIVPVLTHEFGHFIGLAHTTDEDEPPPLSDLGEQDTTVMRAFFSDEEGYDGSIRKNDREAVCAIYPQNPLAPLTQCAPRNGFSPECALEPSVGGWCAAERAPRARAGNEGLVLLAALAGSALLRRRLRRAAPPRARVRT